MEKLKEQPVEKKEVKNESTDIVIEKLPMKPTFQQNFVGVLAEEIARTVVERLPKMIPMSSRKKTPKTTQKKIENPIFLDTSAVIDRRVFDLVTLGVFTGNFVVPEGVLLELKHIADSPDPVRKERGRRGLELLEKLKKNKHAKVIVLSPEKSEKKQKKEVDEQLIDLAKSYKAKLITCDYNLEKKASIHGVIAINMHALAQALKVMAVPGEALSIKVLHTGKDTTQGVGYLDDGTMLVIEKGSDDIGTIIDVMVSRVIQTASGKILFAKKV